MKKLLTLLLVGILVLHGSCGSHRKMASQQKYMRETYQNLKTALNEAEVSMLNDTIKVLFPEHLLFQKSSATINEQVYPLMLRFADALKRYSRTDILINGYTDSSGPEELNNKLSKDRADNAKTVLLNNGVSNARMLTWGLGSNHPIADNNDPETRSRNRRVEFIILYSYGN